MMRSLFSAISGLKGHQTMMDVVGNNISNVNTTAFKAGRDHLPGHHQPDVRGAQAPARRRAASTRCRSAWGCRRARIDALMTQGNLQSTGKPTDLAIQGDGYFQMTDGTNTFYTRDGNFTTDSAGAADPRRRRA